MPFALAGLYDSWIDPESGEIFNTFSVITTKANPMLEKIHNTKKRMPVILNKRIESDWIDPKTIPEAARSLLIPFDENELTAYPVTQNAISKDSDPHSSRVIEKAEYPGELNLFDT